MFNLSGKVAIVTGARRGIGRGIAFSLAQAGARVAVADLEAADAESVAEEIEKQTGSAAIGLRCDVTEIGEVQEMVDRTIESLGGVDILVNNAGIAPMIPFEDLTEDQWEQTLAVNLKGQFFCSQSVVPVMKENEWGRIVNIASIASGQVGVGFPGVAHYCASKGGVTALTESLALELAPYGIRVNSVGPGIIETEMTNELLADEATRDNLLARTVIGRFGRPEDIGPLVVYLASEEADFVTGATFFIDGGWLAS